jgi:hypothetical protein
MLGLLQTRVVWTRYRSFDPANQLPSSALVGGLRGVRDICVCHLVVERMLCTLDHMPRRERGHSGCCIAISCALARVLVWAI